MPLGLPKISSISIQVHKLHDSTGDEAVSIKLIDRSHSGVITRGAPSSGSLRDQFPLELSTGIKAKTVLPFNTMVRVTGSRSANQLAPVPARLKALRVSLGMQVMDDMVLRWDSWRQADSQTQGNVQLIDGCNIKFNILLCWEPRTHLIIHQYLCKWHPYKA